MPRRTFSVASEIALAAAALHQRHRAPAATPAPAGVPVLVVPGFGCTDAWTTVLRRDLARRGHRVEGWRQGRNDGRVRPMTHLLMDRIRAWVSEHGPTALVGWSLGGVLSREATRELDREQPGRILGIITVGTPVVGGPKYTAVADWYRQRGVDVEAIAAEVEQRNRAEPLQVPLTSIYSRRDPVVQWHASRDPWHDTEHVEVDTGHLGLVMHPRVVDATDRALRRLTPPR